MFYHDAERKHRDRLLVRNLRKWKKIIMLPDEQIRSNEVVRPFVILQPTFSVVQNESTFQRKKG